MAAPVPTLETVITAVKTRMDTIGGLGTVRTYDHTFEDDAEFYEDFQDVNFEMDLWIVDVWDGIDEAEGDATGETYEIYKLRIRYWSVRVNKADWSALARVKFEAVRTELSGNAAIFAIGGQRQLRTPETVQVRKHSKEQISNQMLYESFLTLDVEARRWS